MDYSSLVSALIGGGVVAFIKYFLDGKKEANFNLNKIAEDRYRSLLVFMVCAIDIKKKKYFTINEQIVQQSSEDYLKQIKEYYYHSLLYAPDDVLVKLKKFIQEPNRESYIIVAKAMRKDLWKRKTKLKYEDILID